MKTPPYSLHLEFLRERIYQTRTKWPHFEGMLSSFVELAETLAPNARVVDLERAYVYGGTCIFAPLFVRQRLIALDCVLPSARERYGYQADWTNDPRCILYPPDGISTIDALPLCNDSVDALLIPNIIHHVRDQDEMFAEFARVLSPTGKGYIFEALVRELHQVPDDYVRYTPFGFDSQLQKHGLKMTRWTPTTGVFDVIAYSWIQALDFLPEPEKEKMSSWFYESEFPRLTALDGQFRTNLVNGSKSFPMAFVVEFEKGQGR
jgi:SAM-dependent methyltransferase